MKRIEKCVCSCCGHEDMMIIFVTNKMGNVETKTNFLVDDSYDNSPYTKGRILNLYDLDTIFRDSHAIEVMCMECMGDCNELDLKFEGESMRRGVTITGKELVREVLEDMIDVDDAVWTLNDLETMMGTPKERTR